MKPNPLFTRRSRLAPAMTGRAMKKLNSAATGRLMPPIMPPRIVEPEREVPGIRASIWKSPMKRLSRIVISSSDSTRVRILTFFSRMMYSTP